MVDGEKRRAVGARSSGGRYVDDGFGAGSRNSLLIVRPVSPAMMSCHGWRSSRGRLPHQRRTATALA